MSSPFADDEPSAEREDGGGVALPGVLRASLIVLIASTIVIFLSAVVSSNAPPNSRPEQLALAVHRLGMFAMLIGFFGILAAYRLPAVLAYLRARTSGEAAVDGKRKVLAPDLQFLVAASALLILWVWIMAWFGSALLHQLTVWILLAGAGFLANLALMHEGCIRSFAVGTLVATLLAIFSARGWQQLMIFGQGPFASGARPSYRGFLVNFALEVTVVLLAGLACAFYYRFVARARARAAAD